MKKLSDNQNFSILDLPIDCFSEITNYFSTVKTYIAMVRSCKAFSDIFKDSNFHGWKNITFCTKSKEIQNQQNMKLIVNLQMEHFDFFKNNISGLSNLESLEFKDFQFLMIEKEWILENININRRNKIKKLKTGISFGGNKKYNLLAGELFSNLKSFTFSTELIKTETFKAKNFRNLQELCIRFKSKNEKNRYEPIQFQNILEEISKMQQLFVLKVSNLVSLNTETFPDINHTKFKWNKLKNLKILSISGKRLLLRIQNNAFKDLNLLLLSLRYAELENEAFNGLKLKYLELGKNFYNKPFFLDDKKYDWKGSIYFESVSGFREFLLDQNSGLKKFKYHFKEISSFRDWFDEEFLEELKKKNSSIEISCTCGRLKPIDQLIPTLFASIYCYAKILPVCKDCRRCDICGTSEFDNKNYQQLCCCEECGGYFCENCFKYSEGEFCRCKKCF